MWADGLTPRADGLTWACPELQSDGTHPAPSGQRKVAAMLLDFLHADPTARPWYVARQAAEAPAIGAVVNSAGYGAAMATGSLASIYGTGLAGAPAQALSLPLPHELGGTRVLMDGAPLELHYVSPSQINFVLPLAGVNLTVARDDATSAPFAASAGFWAPGLYTLDGAPNGPAAAQFADGTVVTPARPARRGDTLQVFGTGLGYVNPLLMMIAVAEPVVLVGNVKAKVTYCGPAPFLPGVTQINFTIPDAAPTGAAVPLVFQLGTASSNAATLAVVTG